MATVAASLYDNSVRDNTGDAINGSEVDANPTTIAEVLDGDQAIDLGQSGTLDIQNLTGKDLTAAAGGVVTCLTLQTDPSSGTATDGDGVQALFKGDDAGGTATTYGSLQCVFDDTDATSEDASFVFKTMAAGTLTTVFTIKQIAGLTCLVLGTARIWEDTVNTFLRVKFGSDPTSETDGVIFMNG